MQVAMLPAGFTAGEADQLRRAMAAWKRKDGLDKYYDRIVNGMTGRGYDKAFAGGIFQQILGFGEYGFPESHAASFALLVYASSRLKRHEPESFLAAMLNSQSMGFYSPLQLVQDATRHQVQVLPVDVTISCPAITTSTEQFGPVAYRCLSSGPAASRGGEGHASGHGPRLDTGTSGQNYRHATFSFASKFKSVVGQTPLEYLTQW